MGLTDKGFYRPTFNEILQDKINRAKQLFGENVKTDELSVLGKFIRIEAYDLSKMYEDLESTYYARFPNTASGVSLDRLCAFVAITRNPPTAAVHKVTLTGTAGYVIPIGLEVGTDNDITFYNVSEVTIPSSGVAEINVMCDVAGLMGNVSNNAIAKIINPNANITDITASEIVEYGVEEESDTDLRKRFTLAAQGGGSCNANAVIANVLRVPTVNDVSVNEDLTNHQFTVYVYGGTNYKTEIAQAIFEKTPIGIKTVGSESVTVKDVGGYDHTVNFSFTSNVSIYVKFKLTKGEDFPLDGIAQIKNNIVNYINNLGVGTDVVTTSMYSKIYSVGGVQDVTDLNISKNGTAWSTENITVTDNQVANITDAHIAITEV